MAVKSLTREYAQRDWQGIVQEYSRRKLTHDNDELPALSGLANIYHQLNPSRYLAGIWGSSLLRGILWRTELCEAPIAPPASWRAPSWIWASTNECIDYDLAQGDINDAACQAAADADIEVDSVDPFGRLAWARLHIRGREKPIHKWTISAFHTASDAITDGLTVRAHVDAKSKWNEEERPSYPCQLLLLLLTGSRGLVVACIQEDEAVYKRIGVFIIAPRYRSHDIDSWQQVNMTLI